MSQYDLVFFIVLRIVSTLYIVFCSIHLYLFLYNPAYCMAATLIINSVQYDDKCQTLDGAERLSTVRLRQTAARAYIIRPGPVSRNILTPEIKFDPLCTYRCSSHRPSAIINSTNQNWLALSLLFYEFIAILKREFSEGQRKGLQARDWSCLVISPETELPAVKIFRNKITLASKNGGQLITRHRPRPYYSLTLYTSSISTTIFQNQEFHT